MKLELSFKYKGKERFYYGDTIKNVALDSYNEYFKNEITDPTEVINNYENYIKYFLYGKLKFVGSDIVYFTMFVILVFLN